VKKKDGCLATNIVSVAMDWEGENRFIANPILEGSGGWGMYKFSVLSL
jgi:hypothetical protein